MSLWFFLIICGRDCPGSSAGLILSEKTQARFVVRLVLFLSKLIRERRTSNKRKPHSKLQLEMFSILLTSAFVFVFVFLLRLCCLSLTFLLICFHCSNVRCHALCCIAWRAMWVVCSHAFLLRCRWFRAPVDREGALRLSVQVQVVRRLSVRLTRRSVWLLCSNNVVLRFLPSAF